MYYKVSRFEAAVSAMGSKQGNLLFHEKMWNLVLKIAV
jgi:hypothetical protein